MIKIEKLPKGHDKKKESKDYRQYKRLFLKEKKGGLSKHQIEEHKRLRGASNER